MASCRTLGKTHSSLEVRHAFRIDQEPDLATEAVKEAKRQIKERMPVLSQQVKRLEAEQREVPPGRRAALLCRSWDHQ